MSIKKELAKIAVGSLAIVSGIAVVDGAEKLLKKNETEPAPAHPQKQEVAKPVQKQKQEQAPENVTTNTFLQKVCAAVTSCMDESEKPEATDVKENANESNEKVRQAQFLLQYLPKNEKEMCKAVQNALAYPEVRATLEFIERAKLEGGWSEQSYNQFVNDLAKNGKTVSTKTENKFQELSKQSHHTGFTWHDGLLIGLTAFAGAGVLGTVTSKGGIKEAIADGATIATAAIIIGPACIGLWNETRTDKIDALTQHCMAVRDKCEQIIKEGGDKKEDALRREMEAHFGKGAVSEEKIGGYFQVSNDVMRQHLQNRKQRK